MEDIYFDSHIHLADERFDKDRAEVVKRAKEAGVARMIVVGGDAPANTKSLQIVNGSDGNLFASAGYHPNGLIDASSDWRKEIERLAQEPGVVALGETGLDLFRKRVPFNMQMDAFQFHLKLSSETGLPVIIHQRSAEKEMVETLKTFADKNGPVKGVMHCFAGDEKYAAVLANLGMYVSFSGIITFPRNRSQRYALAEIPEDRLLVETDGPFLPPEGHRGERCEPAMLPIVTTLIAEQLKLDPEDIARITRRNAIELFGITVPDEGVFTYAIRHSLYINMTNKCSNKCDFCPRHREQYIVKGHNLKIDREPSAEEVIKEVERQCARREFKEAVFCGLGEPTIRMDALTAIGKALRGKGLSVRLNTNGLGSVINKRDIVPMLKEAVNELSISLNATDAKQYAEICRPPGGAKAYAGLLDFAKRAVQAGIKTTLSVVMMPGLDVEKARKTAASLGAGFRVRKRDRVG
jgi:TatD DNase family protein